MFRVKGLSYIHRFRQRVFSSHGRLSNFGTPCRFQISWWSTLAFEKFVAFTAIFHGEKRCRVRNLLTLEDQRKSSSMLMLNFSTRQTFELTFRSIRHIYFTFGALSIFSRLIWYNLCIWLVGYSSAYFDCILTVLGDAFLTLFGHDLIPYLMLYLNCILIAFTYF